jgi:hypothetical protein
MWLMMMMMLLHLLAHVATRVYCILHWCKTNTACHITTIQMRVRRLMLILSSIVDNIVVYGRGCGGGSGGNSE